MGQVSPFTGQPSGDSGMPPPGFKVQPMEDVNMSDEVESPPPNNRAGFAPLGFFRRAVFQRLLLFSTVKLFVYLYKLYDDCDSTIQFYEKLEVYFFIISVASLIVPPIFYAIYLIGANLAKDDILDGTEIGTKAVNGLLLCPWQIKRHLDVLHFAAQRACMWRTPDQDEEQEQQAMERAADVLEFFEDFYAGFLQIFLQFYIYLGTQKLG
ncbi:hypothetical protein HDE_08565 [Halotydeus destructor]|nr:hypothetical protein HDE_08565 [Halotydeus destructor]